MRVSPARPAAHDPVVLALDLGTSSCRAALFDHRGTRIPGATAQRTYRLDTDAAGKAILDPQDLFAAIGACISEVCAAPGPAISAVGVSCFWHSLVGCDADGRALTPILTWADSRCTPDAVALRKQHAETEVHARTGCMLRTSFWPAKLRWLARTEPTLFKRIHRFVAPAEWLYWLLCGEPTTAHGMATGTGCYDPAKKAWDDALLAASKITGRVPTISDAPARLRHGFARRWPRLAQADWHPAIGDGAANNLGAGATSPGLAAINFGTSGAIRIVRDSGTPVAPFGLFCYRIDDKRFLIGGAISNAGGLRQWCLDHLKLPEGEALEAALAARPGPDHHLAVLPFWLAERAPTWREDLSGAITGLRQATTALDLYQAITEATYHRLATIAERVPGRKNLTALVGGGLQKSPASLQRLADVTGLPLIACDEAETSLRGAAVLVLERLGQAKHLTPIGGRAVKPRPALAKRYAAERRRLATLEQQLFPDT